MKDRVLKIIADQLSIKTCDIIEDHDIVSDLGADSLDQVELIVWMEEEFDIEIPDDDAEKIQTIEDVITYVKGKIEA